MLKNYYFCKNLVFPKSMRNIKLFSTKSPQIKTKEDIIAKIHKYNMNTVTMVSLFNSRDSQTFMENLLERNMILTILLMLV
jgi:hypothetical protein